MAVTPANELYTGTFDTTAIVVAIFIALSLYNASELLLTIFLTFKRWKSLYFWSLLIATIAVIPYSIGALLWYYQLSPSYAGSIVNNVGWIAMVSGQSMVLYSRLHLVLRNQKVLRAVLWMIVVDGVVFYISATVIQFGAYSTKEYDVFARASYVFEKIQMTGFSIQEFIISGLYIKEMFRLSKSIFDENKRRTVWQLLVVQIIIVCLDISLLVLEYMDLTVYQQNFKSVSYSVKLKMEFAVLGSLIASVRDSDNTRSKSSGADERSDFRKSTPKAPTRPDALHVDKVGNRGEWMPIPEDRITGKKDFELSSINYQYHANNDGHAHARSSYGTGHDQKAATDTFYMSPTDDSL